MEQQPAGRGRRVNGLVEHDEIHAERLEFFGQRHKVVRGAGELIELHAGDHIDSPLPDGFEERVQGRPTLLGAGDAVVHELGECPAAGARERPNPVEPEPNRAGSAG
jgi:hypothetical protein